MLNQLQTRLKNHSPWRLSSDLKPRAEAGVICLLTDEPEPQVILTQRGGHLSTHAGEVAFPGGKRDPEDADVLATALREAQEEVGVKPGEIELLGELSQIFSLHKLAVTPFVGIVSADVQLRPNPGEIDSIFKTPLSFLLNLDNARVDKFAMVDGRTRFVPSWQYQQYEIWGLTAWVLAELLNVGLDAGIPTRPRPERSKPERSA